MACAFLHANALFSDIAGEYD